MRLSLRRPGALKSFVATWRLENPAIYRTAAAGRSKWPLEPARSRRSARNGCSSPLGAAVRSKWPLEPASEPLGRSESLLEPASNPPVVPKLQQKPVPEQQTNTGIADHVSQPLVLAGCHPSKSAAALRLKVPLAPCLLAFAVIFDFLHVFGFRVCASMPSRS